MEKFKGTPCPWQVAGPCCDAVVVEFDSAGYKAICHRPERTGGKMTDEYNANMQLIAAAPELLEALQYINHAINHGTQMDIVKGQEMAESAINKALGE